jgi:hypothetical protein
MTSSFKSGYIASSDLELSNMGTESKISSTSCPCAQLEFLRDDPLQRILILLLSVRTFSISNPVGMSAAEVRLRVSG